MQGVETDPDGVETWTDLSVHRHVARQFEIARRPAYVPAAFGEFAGIRFDGANDRLTVADHPSLQMGTKPFFLGIVLINTSKNCCQQIILAKQNREVPFAGVGVFVNWWLTPGDWEAPPPSGEFAGELTWYRYAATPFSDAADYRDEGPRLVSLVRTPDNFSIRVNGQVLDSTSPITPDGPVDSSATGMDLTLGNHVAEDWLAFQGAIAEVVFVSEASSRDVVDMERYLRGKYAGVLKE